jgi:hypothetical protein
MLMRYIYEGRNAWFLSGRNNIEPGLVLGHDVGIPIIDASMAAVLAPNFTEGFKRHSTSVVRFPFLC